jgi:hypothetical protein
VIGQNLNAASDQEEHAKQVDEVRCAKPKGKAEVIHTTSSLKRFSKNSSACLSLASDGPTYNRPFDITGIAHSRTFAQAAQITPAQ